MSAADRLRRDAAARVLALRQSLERSRCPADAAPLLLRLEEAARALPERGGAYLRLRRELKALWRALWRAELSRYEGDRAARAELQALAQLLAALRPSLEGPLRVLLPEVPVDQAAPERLAALRALLLARQEIVPHLAAARPRWKR